jgi:predicted molibdopterin-dependent oxidoreductase YjgC
VAARSIRYTPGQTAALAGALVALVRAEGLLRGEYASHTAVAGSGDAQALAAQAGVALDTLRELAQALAAARAATILYDEEATLEPDGETLAADVLELALLTDNFGRSSAGAGPLLRAANSLGARDMGLLPDQLPGYALASDEAARARYSRAWGGAEIAAEPGLDYAGMAAGGVKALWVLGADPTRHLGAGALRDVEFLVVQDLFLTEAAKRADVVLPAVSYAEKDGTITNTERTVQVLRRAMVPLPGARADWEILRDVARALGLTWSYRSPGDVLAEIGDVIPIYAGATRRGLGQTGARWPLAPAPAEDGARPKAVLRESPALTWEMLRDGVAAAAQSAEPAAAGRGE